MSTKGYCLRRNQDISVLLSQEASQKAVGVRACEIFGSSTDSSVRCVGMELDPQVSTEAEKNMGPVIAVFVTECDPDMGSLTLNGARMQLQVGDHIIIPSGTTFQFTNSSLEKVLSLRLVHRTPLGEISIADNSVGVDDSAQK